MRKSLSIVAICLVVAILGVFMFVGKADTAQVGVRIGVKVPLHSHTDVNNGGLLYLNENTANLRFGYQALSSVTTGSYNYASGYEALKFNTSGQLNSAIGYKSLRHNSTGSYNNAIGYNSLLLNTTGLYNIAIGNDAIALSSTGSYNSAIGFQALYSNTTGSHNIAIGNYSLQNNSTGSYNIAIGEESLYSNPIIFNTGSNNIAFGYRALYTNTSGSGNIAIGFQAGYYETGSNKLIISNSSTTTPLIQGDFTVSSPSLTINGSLGVTTGSSANKVVCWKTGGLLGYCSSVVAADGSCTCN